MDLRIEITDENGNIMDRFTVYQDGSDSEGTAFIRKLIGAAFTIEQEEDQL